MGADVADVLPWLELADQCHLAALHETCLQQLAHRLAAAGDFWFEQVRLTSGMQPTAGEPAVWAWLLSDVARRLVRLPPQVVWCQASCLPISQSTGCAHLTSCDATSTATHPNPQARAWGGGGLSSSFSESLESQGADVSELERRKG